jgi:hypothetical protein
VTTDANVDPIETYLDRLLLELRGRASDVRRVLAEVEEHLRDAVADGATPEEAIERFGSPRAVARRFEPAHGVVFADLARLGWQLVAIGCLAIGLSGVLSVGMRAAFGDAFVAGDPSGVTYTQARCADFAEYHPESAGCTAAANAHHADEVEIYRIAVGVLGLIGLAIWRWKLRQPSARLPVELGPSLAAVAFALVGVGLAAQGFSMLAEGVDHGAGQWLSGSAVALVAAAIYGWQLLRQLQLRAHT